MTISGLSEDFGRLILEIPPIEINGVRNVIRSLAKEFPLGIISDTGYIAGRHIRNFLEKEGDILDTPRFSQGNAIHLWIH